MKLKTNMDTCLPRGTIGDIEHDAAAAHALMLAMDEEITHVSTVQFNANEICAHFMEKVKARADETMKKWGFDV
jgi:hypothetical protein